MLLITGKPGTGKTTALLRTVEHLKARSYSVGGMVSREVRSSGIRVGFEVMDLNSGRKGWLAHVNHEHGPRVGRYRINLGDLNDIGVNAISDALERADVIAIDEIGPMELFSEKFKAAAWKALDSRKLVIAVVHWKAQNKLINEAKKREDAETIIVTVENREKLHEQITEKSLGFLKQI